MIFAETMKHKENFMRPYNFSSLPYGDYTIALTDEQGTREKKVSYVPETKKRIAHLTRLNPHEKKYVLGVVNDGHDALTIRIYNEDSKLLYQKSHEIQGDFAVVYNLNELAGAHTFEIVDQQGNVIRLEK